MLPHYTCCVLSRLCCNGHSFLLSSSGLAESRIIPAVLVDTRPRTPLVLFCTVQLWTDCAAHSLATLCLFLTSGPDPGELPDFWGSMVFYHAPIPRKGSGNNNNNNMFCSCSGPQTWMILHVRCKKVWMQ